MKRPWRSAGSAPVGGWRRGVGLLSAAIAAGLVATACGGAGASTSAGSTNGQTPPTSATSASTPPTAAPSSTTTTSTTSTSTTSTTTTTVPIGISPLTGEPQPNQAILNRPALVVKIDNVAGAFPQSGIGAADVVIEEEVEGGLTRLAAIFQSHDAAAVGPVRSTRTSDIEVVDELNDPLYAYSGGNTAFVAAIQAARMVDVGANDAPGAYYRSDAHYEPHNLYTSTYALYRLARSYQGPPPKLFDFRAPGATVDQAGAQRVSKARVIFPASEADWVWNKSLSVWQRWQNGSPVIDALTGKQIGVQNVIIQRIPYGTDGWETGEGVAPVPIPIAEQIGQGEAWVLTDGKVIEGSWSRSSEWTPATYIDAADNPILLTPGQTWIELLPDGSVPSFS